MCALSWVDTPTCVPCLVPRVPWNGLQALLRPYTGQDKHWMNVIPGITLVWYNLKITDIKGFDTVVCEVRYNQSWSYHTQRNTVPTLLFKIILHFGRYTKVSQFI